MEYLKSFFFKKDIIAKIVYNGPVNQKNSQKLMLDIAKASKSKDNIVAVALSVNSEGGSGIQASISGSKISAFAKRKNVPLYSFAETLTASGGYWILSVGDKLYAHKDSLVGHIGVRSVQSNFRKLFDETKIKRCVITTSDQLYERIMDPLKPEEEQTEAERLFILDYMEDSYQYFKGHVLKHRGDKIKIEYYDRVFNADVFSGNEALKCGLVDEIGVLDDKMKEKYPNAEIVNFSKETPWESIKRKIAEADDRNDTAFVAIKFLNILKDLRKN